MTSRAQDWSRAPSARLAPVGTSHGMTHNITLERPDLSDDLWSWQHVARFFGCGRSAAMELVREEWFPAPVAKPGDRRWLAGEVRAAIQEAPRREKGTAPIRSPRRQAATTPDAQSPRASLLLELETAMGRAA